VGAGSPVSTVSLTCGLVPPIMRTTGQSSEGRVKQVSAWGDFWFTLARRRVYAGGILSPLSAEWVHKAYFEVNQERRPNPCPPYTCQFRVFDAKDRAIHFRANGNTMAEMLRHGLQQTGQWDLQMQLCLLAVVTENLLHKLERIREQDV
jgi:hypothetical protein